MMKPISSPEYSNVVAVLVDGKRILDPIAIDEETNEVQCWIPAPPEIALDDDSPPDLSDEELEASAEWSTKTIKGRLTLVRKK